MLIESSRRNLRSVLSCYHNTNMRKLGKGEEGMIRRYKHIGRKKNPRACGIERHTSKRRETGEHFHCSVDFVGIMLIDLPSKSQKIKT